MKAQVLVEVREAEDRLVVEGMVGLYQPPLYLQDEDHVRPQRHRTDQTYRLECSTMSEAELKSEELLHIGQSKGQSYCSEPTTGRVSAENTRCGVESLVRAASLVDTGHWMGWRERNN